MRGERHAVEASASSGEPQAAVVGIVVTDAFEIFFDTLDTSRKAVNLRKSPSVAFVIGSTGAGAERTVQYAGTVDEPRGEDLASLKRVYFGKFADGRERETLEGITYFRARPAWLRYSDYGKNPPAIVELNAHDLAALR